MNQDKNKEEKKQENKKKCKQIRDAHKPGNKQG